MDPHKELRTEVALLWVALLSFLAAGAIIVLHLRFVVLPLSFFLLGMVSYRLAGRRALFLYLFLLPLINSLPDLFFNGYPFNYMAVALFYLAGLMLVSLQKGERLPLAHSGSRVYLFFLGMVLLSVLFVFLRWSNLVHSPLAAFRDTPVAPDGQRLSFGAIFPVVTLFLFSFSPLLAALLRHHRISARQALLPLSLGLCLSVGLALLQRLALPDLLGQKWWSAEMNHVNGGFSDFNAFGFFSGLVFLAQVIVLVGAWKSATPWKRALHAPFLLASLAGVYLSGCRTAFLFGLAALAYLICSRKMRPLVRAAFVVAAAALFLVAGGALKRRVLQSFDYAKGVAGAPSLFQGVDRLTNKRLTMIANSLSMLGRHPLVGVGAGNFIFYLKYLHYGVPHYEDLPLNQYLLIADELGLCGLALFIFFLWSLARGAPAGRKYMLLVVGVALFFNFFFWFPECILLFFVLFATDGEGDASTRPRYPLGRIIGFSLLALSLAGHLLSWKSLDPVRWAGEKGTRHDYGFWYPEQGAAGEFRWSLARAGIYLHGEAPLKLRFTCAAPLRQLRGGKQVLRLYWRGKFQRQVIFRENEDVLWQPPAGRAGFFELRVLPSFNLKAMGIGPEGRDLGIQVALEK